MKLYFPICGFLISFSQFAFAVSVPPVSRGQAVCYGREYSTAHMEKSSLQTIKRMDVKFFDEGHGTILMNLRVDVKTRSGYRDIGDGKREFFVETRPYSNTLVCQTYQGKYWCGVECDGGSVHFEGGFGQSVKLVNDGVTVEGGCGEDGDTIFIPPVKGGDDFFTLFSLPSQFCQR